MTNRHIAFQRLHNFRDLGGYRTQDGRTTRWRWLYRSDSLGKLSGEDWTRFLDLGVRTVIDLRYPWEADAKGRIPDSDRFDYLNLSIEHRPYDQATIAPDTDPCRFLADRYAEVAADGVVEIRQALEAVAASGESAMSATGNGQIERGREPGPVVFHCTAGKDRTGLLAALILHILGVSESDIVQDFALTELATDGIIADWRAGNPGRDLPWPFFGRAPGKLMELVLADLAADYGSMSAYVTDAVGLDDHTVQTMRDTLLTRS